MDGYIQISLTNILEAVGEDKTKELLSSFSCPLNKDVEAFLRSKAILFSRQSIAETHLVFASHKGNPRLIAYFTVAMKSINIPKNNISKVLAKKISKFGWLNIETRCYIIPSVLIAQLGKNFSGGLNRLITGDELLQITLNKIHSAQAILGGKVIYVECEDKHCLKSFYGRHGFTWFGNRALDRDEQDSMSGTHLVQMLRYPQKKR